MVAELKPIEGVAESTTTPNGWRKVVLGDVLGAKGYIRGPFGSALRRGELLTTGGVPVYEQQHAIYHSREFRFFVDSEKHRELARFTVQPNDLIISCSGTLGKVSVVRPNDPLGIISQALLLLRPDTSVIDPQFFYYLLSSPAGFHSMVSVSSGSVQVNIAKRSIIEGIEFLLPPLVEQKAIAAVLGALDDKIELNRRMNATLEAMARALFQSWFVDFDAVRAKVDGRQPAGLDPATAALFPEHFEHTEDGLLPLGWRRAAIEEVCDINTWTLGKNDDFETLDYVEISEVSRGDIANIARYKRGEEPSRARRRLRHGDTVLSTVRPDRGSYFLALNPQANRVVSTGFAVLTPTKVPWSFVHAAMTQPEVSDHLGQMADGGAYPAVRPEIIGAIQVTVPNQPKILDAFHRICAPLFEQAEANRMQSRSLATTRDVLLPKLLSGEFQLHVSS